MAKLEIDLNASKVLLLAVRNMLNELLGEASAPVLSAAAKGAAVVTAASLDEILDNEPDVLSEAADDLETNEAEEAGKGAPATSSADSGAAATTQNAASTGTAAAATSERGEVDEHGVEKDPEFCGTAAKPFYGSGKRKGQWKKRQGVTDTAYDEWYADELAVVDAIDATVEDGYTEVEDEPVDTAAAFGAEETAAKPTGAPTEAGEFMGWLAEKQAAGVLNQEQIGAAYAAAGVQVTDLFPGDGKDEDTIAAAIAGVYAILAAQI